MATPQVPGNTDGEAALAAPPNDKKISYMSLPKKAQLAILCLARLADPLATTSIQVRGGARAHIQSTLSGMMADSHQVIHVLPVEVLRSFFDGCRYFVPSRHHCRRQDIGTSLHRHVVGPDSRLELGREEGCLDHWTGELL